MIRIGVVNIDVSHPLRWSELFLEEERARYVAVYNDGFRGDDEVEAFIEKRGLEKRCSSIEELAGMVDVVFVQGCNWDKHLGYAKQVIAAGKPVFVDKPIAGTIADLEELERLVKGGATILGSSSVRYCMEIEDFLAKPVEERGEIVHVYGTAGNNEFDYAIHIVEAIGGVLGAGAESTEFVGRSEVGGKACETFHVEYASGASATYNTFHGTFMPFVLVIMTTTGTFHFQVQSPDFYRALHGRLLDVLEGGGNRIAPIETLTESVKIMLAGRLSREAGGGAVRIADIPADDPGYDGEAFEKEYAAKAKKIYLDE